jgi:thioesterase domain-containing protein
VARLDTDRPVYGLESHDPPDAPGRASLQTIAQEYAQAIQEKQAHGPYHFLGFSLGGFVALCVASILESQGHEVAFLGLVECDPKWADSSVSKEKIIAHLIVEMYTGIQKEMQILVPLSEKTLMEEAGRISAEILRSRNGRNVEPLVRWLSEGGYVHQDVSIDVMTAYLTMFASHVRLVQELEPVKVAAPLHVWLSDKSRLTTSDAFSRWATYTQSNVMSQIIEGDHYGLLYPPAVETLAEALGSRLRSLT